jgi:hypothetical protein
MAHTQSQATSATAGTRLGNASGRCVSAILRGAWAPLAVLAASFPLAGAPYAEAAYSALHVLGGVALAYFARRAVRLLHAGWPPVLSSVVALALACTGALAWEIAEFGIDFVFGTMLQEGLLDTMTDLILAAAGAAAWLALRRGVQDFAPWRTVRPAGTTDRQRSRQSA